jgi:hypothetical protein
MKYNILQSTDLRAGLLSEASDQGLQGRPCRMVD